MALVDELAFCDAIYQADLVRRKELTTEELTEAAIARAERVNPALNAIVTPMFDQARAQAKAVSLESPLAGVPFLLKDLLASYAGVRMSSGSRFTCNMVPDRDSELVRRFKRAGLVIMGKTNTPEFGALPTTEPVLFGPTCNPWDTARSTGGSSGGSAARRACLPLRIFECCMGDRVSWRALELEAAWPPVAFGHTGGDPIAGGCRHCLPRRRRQFRVRIDTARALPS